jgi:hypothetical protein
VLSQLDRRVNPIVCRPSTDADTMDGRPFSDEDICWLR